VLLVLYDDTGLAAWSPYGGRISMPTLQRLADNGLMYTQWHTCALCSPTRSTVLTGRNHHLNGMAQITEGADGYPGADGYVPAQCATLAEILQDNGWGTFWVGKDHNVPEQDVAPGASRHQWPVQMGFDRYYGFLGGETNQWYPDLVEDNRFVDQPYGPEQGYHLSKDLTDHAIEMLRNLKASNPSKPWFMWFCPGANHAPHQAPTEYIAKYKGKFDDGYDAYRTWVLQRMIDKNGDAPGTALTPLNPLPDSVSNPGDAVRPWDTLSPDEKKLFAHMAEVYAGFSEYTDAQVGRIIDYLQETKQLDNTLVIYCADNGASGEGSPSGSVNENKFFNNYPDSIAENMKYLSRLGTPDTYNHYPTGWAAAFSTPFQMFKRYANFAGGTCCPLVISWPHGHQGEGRSPEPVPSLDRPRADHPRRLWPADADDLSRGPAMAALRRVDALQLRRAPGGSDAEAHPVLRDAGHARTLERRLEGGVATRTAHRQGSLRGGSVGALPHRCGPLRVEGRGPGESRQVEGVGPGVERRAQKNLVLPLDDRTAIELIKVERPSVEPARDRYIYYPSTSPVPEGVAVNVRGRSFKILANVELTDPNASGVIFAHGSRFGGHTLFIKAHRLHYVYNFLGIAPEQQFVSPPLTRGKHSLGMEFIRDTTGSHGESIGHMKLYVDDRLVAQGPMRTQAGKFTLAGDGLCVGYDSGDAVSQEYRTPARSRAARSSRWASRWRRRRTSISSKRQSGR
jgi:arylsulfatase